MNRKWIFKFIIIVTLFNSCKNESKTNTDYILLNTYINNYKIKNNIDSVILANNNANIEIFKTYDKNLKLKIEPKEDIKNIVFNKKEFENYKTQSKDSSFWEKDIYSKLNSVYPENESINKEDLLYITKPFYTIDKKYAMLYSYKKIGRKKMIFIPRIEVYQNKKGTWEKIDEIKHFQ